MIFQRRGLEACYLKMKAMKVERKHNICHNCCCSIDKLLSLRKKAEEKSKVMHKLGSVLNTETTATGNTN